MKYVYEKIWYQTAKSSIPNHWELSLPSKQRHLKSVNLEYNTLVCWADGRNVSSTKCLSFQVLSFFFIKSCKILLQKPFQFIFLFFFYKITKMKRKSFECPKSIRNYEKKILGMSNAWLTIHLFHRPIESAYCILNWQISRLTGGKNKDIILNWIQLRPPVGKSKYIISVHI